MPLFLPSISSLFSPNMACNFQKKKKNKMKPKTQRCGDGWLATGGGPAVERAR